MLKILLFTEYKTQQALWLQQELSKSIYRDRSFNFSLITKYREYLSICGIGYDITDGIGDMFYKADKKYISYDEDIANNFDGIIDEMSQELINNYTTIKVKQE